MPDEQHDALTAFQIARRRGYRFSEQRWLESLKGERGEKGDKGDRGDRGPRGLDGKDGRDAPPVGDLVSQVLALVPTPKNGVDGRDGQDGELPAPVPWKATFERGPNRLTSRLLLKSAEGESWVGNVMRDPFGSIAEVEFVPTTV